MTLRTRLALVTGAAVAVVTVGAVLVIHAVVRDSLMSEIDHSLLERATPVQVILRDGTGTASIPQPFIRLAADSLQGRAVRGFDAFFVQLVTPEGETIAPPGQPVTLPVTARDLAVAMGEGELELRTVTTADDRLRMVVFPVDFGAVQMARSLLEFDRALASITATLTVIGGAGVVVAALLGLLVARGTLRPLARLTETVEHVTETRELAARIETTGADEVGRLAAQFNAMLSALEASRNEQNQLVRDAGHELRTPLTALRTNIEMLARPGLTEEQHRQLLSSATSELAELSEMAIELVELAADPESSAEATTHIDLGVLAERVVDRYRRRLDQPIELRADASVVSGRPSALERAIGNLIDNAGKWSPPDSPVTVVVDSGRVTVIDAGPGIAPGDRHRVFDRFYRADSDRSTPGSGLGLAIVAKVAADHGGDVFVDQASGGGAAVGFTLPTTPS